MPNVTDRISRDWAAQPMTKAEFDALPVVVLSRESGSRA